VEDEEKYRALFSRIIKGYSEAEYKGEQIFVKHFTESDVGLISEKQNSFFKNAKEQGLPTEKEKLKVLHEQDIWTDKDEEGFKNLQEEIKNQEQTQKNLFIKAQKQILKSKIFVNKKKLTEKFKERAEALDLTCEEYSQRKSHEETVYYALYKDSDLKNKFLSRDRFEEMPQIELHLLMSLHASSTQDIFHDNVKRICVLGFFLNTFFICNDDPLIFYGKPVVDLTIHQVNLFSTGKFFKAMMTKSEAQPPETEDIDELVEWYEASISKEELAKKMEGKDSATLVGATKEDMKGIVQGGGVNLNQQVGEYREKTGKSALDMDDMLKLHGYNIKDGRIKG